MKRYVLSLLIYFEILQSVNNNNILTNGDVRTLLTSVTSCRILSMQVSLTSVSRASSNSWPSSFVNFSNSARFTAVCSVRRCRRVIPSLKSASNGKEASCVLVSTAQQPSSSQTMSIFVMQRAISLY